jgi:hypothetical protein
MSDDRAVERALDAASTPHPPEGEGFPQAPEDHEGKWLRALWTAFGCATNPDDFQRSHRDRMWEQMVEWARKQEQQNRRAYDNGVYSGYQKGLAAADGKDRYVETRGTDDHA